MAVSSFDENKSKPDMFFFFFMTEAVSNQIVVRLYVYNRKWKSIPDYSVSTKRRWRKNTGLHVRHKSIFFCICRWKSMYTVFTGQRHAAFPTYSTPNSILISHHCQGQTNVWMDLYTIINFPSFLQLSDFKPPCRIILTCSYKLVIFFIFLEIKHK